MIRSTGITIQEVVIPPFTVQKGEILVIDIDNGVHFSPVLFQLVDIFSNVVSSEHVQVDRTFVFASHIVDKGWKSFFRRLTVREHIRNAANPNSKLPEEIYAIDRIGPKTKINTLPGSPRKILSVLCALSWSDKIVFDLSGVDPLGAERVLELVKKYIGEEGAAILVDYCNDFENNCSRYVKATYVG
jgi:hypothetical protein